MPPTMSSLGIDRLSVEDRLSLVREIWDSIAAAPGSLLTDAQRAELRRRVADDDDDPDAAIPWEQVKGQALRRLRP